MPVLCNDFFITTVKLGYSDNKENITDKYLRFYREKADYIETEKRESLLLTMILHENPTQLGGIYAMG